MKFDLRLFAAPLALLPLLSLPSAATGSTATLPGVGSAAAAARPGSGRVQGRFNLPDRVTPGTMRGTLEARGSRPLMSFDANVLRNAAAGMGGEIRGLVRILGGPLSGTSAFIHGMWMPTSLGQGGFQAVIFLPPNTTTGRPGRVLAQLRGGFNDPDGPAGPRGAFRGHWRR